MLLFLLVLCVIAGYAGSAYLMLGAGSALKSSVSKQIKDLPAPGAGNASALLDSILPEQMSQKGNVQFQGVRDLFRQAISDADQHFESLTFQGTLAGEQGAIAIINDMPVAAGTEVHGVRIVGISDRILILEYKGERKELNVGETVSVAVD